MGTDTQPNALLLSFIPIAICYRKSLPKPLYLFGFCLLLALFLLCFYNVDFFSLRDVANYFSLLFVTWASYLSFHKVKKLDFKFYAGANIIWLIIGFVQSYIYPTFMTFLLNGAGRGINSEIRGVTSISTEPSQYGTMCVIFAVIGLLNYPIKKIWWVLLILLFQLIMLAQSATAALTLIVALAAFIGVKLLTFNKRAVGYAVIVIAIGFVTYKATYETLKDQRIYHLAEELVKNPILFLAADGSVSERFMFVYYSFKGMIDNNFMPGGYNTFNDYMQEQFKIPKTEVEKLLLMFKRDNYTRILSGIGSVVYQLGIFGFLIPLGIVMCFRGQLFDDKHLFACITLLLILLTAFPLMTSIVGFLLGNSLYLTRKQY